MDCASERFEALGEERTRVGEQGRAFVSEGRLETVFTVGDASNSV